MPVREHAQYHSTGSGSPKWNAALVDVGGGNSTCAFAALRSQTVGCEEGVLACRAPNVHFYYVSFGHLGVISETLAEHPAARPREATSSQGPHL